MKKEILEKVKEDVKSTCFIKVKWYADYKIIRILARKL